MLLACHVLVVLHLGVHGLLTRLARERPLGCRHPLLLLDHATSRSWSKTLVLLALKWLILMSAPIRLWLAKWQLRPVLLKL
uniref:Putative secreted protein n=1 Tax=Ixodes ricinus TaxID=34613 RepID=A0A6B0U6A7_IXORI